MDPQAIIAMLLTIQRIKYYLRTAFGDSDDFFSSLDDILAYQGSCQGNKGSPAFWLAVSVFLVLMLHRLGHFAQIRSAMSLSLFVTTGFLFMDDTDLITVAVDQSESPAQVTAHMQAAVNAWHGGLRATGGALKPDKCSWCLVSFYWDQGQWHYTSPDTQPGALIIPSPQGELVPIMRHASTNAIKVVGVTQALDGNMIAQIQVLQAKAETWVAQISEGGSPDT